MQTLTSILSRGAARTSEIEESMKKLMGDGEGLSMYALLLPAAVCWSSDGCASVCLRRNFKLDGGSSVYLWEGQNFAGGVRYAVVLVWLCVCR